MIKKDKYEERIKGRIKGSPITAAGSRPGFYDL
jgi:hypothetical protein